MLFRQEADRTESHETKSGCKTPASAIFSSVFLERDIVLSVRPLFMHDRSIYSMISDKNKYNKRSLLSWYMLSDFKFNLTHLLRSFTYLLEIVTFLTARIITKWRD